MAPPKRPWFRFYVETFSDPDVRALPPALRWTWGALMGLARSSPVAGVLLDKAGDPITVAAVADFAAVRPAEARAAIAKFTAYGWLLADDDGAISLTAWDRRQFESDDVSARVAKHRRSSGGDVTVDETTKERPSLTGTEVQRTDLTNSSSSQRQSAASGDDDVLGQALAILANRDLERRTVEKGPVGSRASWLGKAITERRVRHQVDAGALLAQRPGLTPNQLADLLEPPDGSCRAACGCRMSPGAGVIHEAGCEKRNAS